MKDQPEEEKVRLLIRDWKGWEEPTIPKQELSKGIEETLKGQRFNEGKLRWDLVDFKALEPMVRGLMYGAKKYSPHQWKLGLDPQSIMASLFRHATAIMNGEIIDEESGVEHIGLLACNMMFWSHFHQKSEKEKLSK